MWDINLNYHNVEEMSIKELRKLKLKELNVL